RLQTQQPVHGPAQRSFARLADVGAHLGVVQVAAELAAPCRSGVKSAAALLLRAELDLFHLIARAFVVDERVRAELADRDEPRPVDELDLRALAFARRDVSAQ